MLKLESAENHSSNEPVVFDADAKASSIKHIQTAYGALSFLKEMIEKGTLTKSIRFNTLSVAGHDIKDLIQILGGEEDLQQQADLKQNMLRQANEEVRRLKGELSKGITKEGISVKIGQMCTEVSDWWRTQGFGYSKGTMSGWTTCASMSVEFNCSIDDFVGTMEEKPISKKAKLKEKQKSLGEQLVLVPEERNSKNMVVLDCPENRSWIMNKLRERFPGIRFHKWESHFIHGNSEQFRLSECHCDFPVENI